MSGDDADSFFYGLHRGNLLLGTAFAAVMVVGSFLTGYTSGVFLFGIALVLVVALFFANEYLYGE